MKFSSQGVPETLAGRYLLQFRGRCPPPFPPFTWPPHPELRWLPPPSFLSHPSPHSPVSHSEFKRRLPLSPLPPPPPYLRPSRADGARRRERGAKKQGPRGARRCGGDARRRVTVRSSGPEPAGRARVRGEPAWARRGRVRGAGVRARVCARPRRSAGRAGGGGGVRTPGTPPPAPRPAPAQPPASVRAAPRLRAQRRRLREPSGAHRLRPRWRCGAAPCPL